MEQLEFLARSCAIQPFFSPSVLYHYLYYKGSFHIPSLHRYYICWKKPVISGCVDQLTSGLPSSLWMIQIWHYFITWLKWPLHWKSLFWVPICLALSTFLAGWPSAWNSLGWPGNGRPEIFFFSPEVSKIMQKL